jgi:DNA-binding response OmpR family regulator
MNGGEPNMSSNSTEPTIRRCILIVEDEPAMVAGRAITSRRRCHEVISAADGVAGLKCPPNDNPDLVVLT